MPKFRCSIIGSCCGGLAWTLTRNENKAAKAVASKEREKLTKKEPEKVEKLLDVDTMELEVGYGLVRLVDTSKGGDLLDRISLIRRQIAIDLGIIVPPVRIRDNMQLGANDYAIKIKGQTVARGVTYPEQFLAMDNGATSGPIPGGSLTTEPAFGLPAYWITESERASAELLNYTVVEATAVLATHLTEVIKSHAHELLSRQDVKNLIDNLKARVPALIEEVIPTQVKPGELQKVMQNLLRERVPVRDLETILETLGDYSTRTKDLDVLTEYVRNALARTICKQYVDESDRLWCVTLDPSLEELINGHLERSERGTTNTMPPQTSQQIVQQISAKMSELTQTGRSGVIFCSPQIRLPLRRMIEAALPQTAVLAYNEVVSEASVEAVAMVGTSVGLDVEGIMNLQTFKASTMGEALTQVKSVMGADAIILHTRTFQIRQWWGLRRREMVEITAGRGVNIGARNARRAAPQRARRRIGAAAGGVYNRSGAALAIRSKAEGRSWKPPERRARRC